MIEIDNAPPLPTASEDEILGRYVYVYGKDKVWDTSLMIQMDMRAMRNHLGAPTVRAWMANPLRRTVRPDQVVFDPTGTVGDECVNLFRGLQIKPEPGDYGPLFELLNHLVENSADNDHDRWRVREFVLNWLALPLQKPGTKMATALVLHGPQGTGKNLFFEAFLQIYGEYAATIGQAQLESRYNDWASRKLFLIADEVVASNELQHFKNALKSIITGGTIQIEEKFHGLRTERNHCNLVFLSNEVKPLALERDDRRHCVIYCPPKRQDGLYQRVSECLANGGAAAFYAMLMQRDLDGFTAHTPPPMTGAKGELIELGLRPPERFAKEWLAGDIDLPLWPCSTQQLYNAFRRWCAHTGERFPTNQATFSSTVLRYAGNRLETRKASPSNGEAGAPIKLWLPKGTGPLNGVRWFDFASEAVQAFEQPLARFCRSHADLSA